MKPYTECASRGLFKVFLICGVLFLSGCNETFVYPEGYPAEGKWMGNSHQGIHDALVKNDVKGCESDNGKSTFYIFRQHESKTGEYLVDCRGWWEQRLRMGSVYKVQVETQEVVKVY